jgi:hypothetical protein
MRPLALAATLLLGACAYNPPSVLLHATPADLEALTGKWVGEYHGDAGGRSGSIVFTLVGGEDHAHGDVFMVARGANRPFVSYQAGRAAAEPIDSTQLLTIRFVAVEAGRISGAMDPYLDPDCDCEAQTVFVGRLGGDVIKGTYTTLTAGSVLPVRGAWSVARRRSS